MVGRPQAEIEDQLEIASARGRLLEGTDRATAEQEIESMPAVFGVGHAVVRDAVGDGAIHVSPLDLIFASICK